MLGTPDQPEAYTAPWCAGREPSGGWLGALVMRNTYLARPCWQRSSPHSTWLLAPVRAILGIGASWFELVLPQLGFEIRHSVTSSNRLEEALQVSANGQGWRPTFSAVVHHQIVRWRTVSRRM